MTNKISKDNGIRKRLLTSAVAANELYGIVGTGISNGEYSVPS